MSPSLLEVLDLLSDRRETNFKTAGGEIQLLRHFRCSPEVFSYPLLIGCRFELSSVSVPLERHLICRKEMRIAC